MNKQEISKLQIDLSKVNAIGQKYFDLFDKHIPTNISGNILIYDISNADCIVNIIQKNPSAKYFVYGNSYVNQAIACINETWDITFLDETFDLYNIDMKFDCIVMNPPYDKQLHLKILEEAIKHLAPNGICVNLSPTPWLAKSNINRPMAKYRKTFNGKIKNIEVIDHATANAMFGTGNSIEELGIYTVKNDNSIPVDLMNYGFSNTVEKSLYDKIDMMNPKAGVITYNKAALDIKYGRVSAKTAYCNKGCKNINIRKPFDVPIYTWHGGKTCKDAVLMLDAKKKVSMVLYFNSQVEHDNFINSLDTVFMNWYYYTFVVPGDYKIINYMFRMSDYSQPWDDARFYKFFNITPDEQKIIEKTMEKYK